jgi:hypothetical protein
MKYNIRGKDGRFIRETQIAHAKYIYGHKVHEVKMVITAPDGQSMSLFGNNTDSQCEAIHAFMEQHKC